MRKNMEKKTTVIIMFSSKRKFSKKNKNIKSKKKRFCKKKGFNKKYTLRTTKGGADKRRFTRKIIVPPAITRFGAEYQPEPVAIELQEKRKRCPNGRRWDKDLQECKQYPVPIASVPDENNVFDGDDGYIYNNDDPGANPPLGSNPNPPLGSNPNPPLGSNPNLALGANLNPE